MPDIVLRGYIHCCQQSLQQPYQVGTISIIPFFYEKIGTERLSNLSKVTQLVNDRARNTNIHTRLENYKPVSFILPTL